MNVDRCRVVSQSCLPAGTAGIPTQGWINEYACGHSERMNDSNVGTPIPWGKAGLSNRGVKGEGSEDKTQHSPFLYHSLGAASVSSKE